VDLFYYSQWIRDLDYEKERAFRDAYLFCCPFSSLFSLHFLIPPVMTIEVPAGLCSWFFIIFLILSLDLGVTLCFFLLCFRYQWACDDLMFPFLGYFLLFFFPFSLRVCQLHLYIRPPPLFSLLFLIFFTLHVSHGLDPFLFIHLSYFLLSCVFAYPFQPILCPVRWSAVHRRVYCVSIVPSVQFGIWCWYDTHGNGARVVFVFFFFPFGESSRA